ncbi:MAG TPA: M28 family metallopeptidase [Pyrinomonadaceae bacterium]|nr:M28 family metallopeptidase [Pyrinomonadaceae bacterium]
MAQSTNLNTNSGAANSSVPPELKTALDSITANDIMQHTKVLSGDEYEGRGPGTKGEELTVQYLTEQYKRIGLKPGNPDGSYIQKVPLVGFAGTPTASFTAGGKQINLTFPQDYVAVSRRFVPESKVENSDVIFVGYGVVAPEYGWDDYKGLDVRGKTIVMLINDPQVPDSADPTKLDDKMFKGKAMTYYGRWTYKYEIAAQKGAAAAVIIHETGPAGYPYEVVSGSWSRENFDIQTPDNNMGRAAVESWITTDRAKELFSAGGHDFDSLKRAALSRDFQPVDLNAKANMRIRNTIRVINSNNVIGKLEGSDPTLKDEYVVYTAHWDHLGRIPQLAGDQIYNGALDNAAGTATLLEIAEAFTKLATPPKRSILFLAVTAEEKGLLGAKYYAENPLYPLNKTLANINMDGVNQWGRTLDITMVGDDNSTLIDLLVEAAAAQRRVVSPDPEPEKGFYFRSDHFEFAKQGVPALYTDSGINYVGKDAAFSKQKRDEYTNHDYHKVTDEIKPDWDLTGAVDDAQLLTMIGYRVSEGDKYPEWKTGSEFKAKRDVMMKSVASSGHASEIDWTLYPNGMRSDREQLKIIPTNRTQALRLHLLLITNKYQSYQSTLLTEDGNTVVRQTGLAATIHDGNTSAVVMKVPVQLLTAGNYRIELTGEVGNGSQEIATYYFHLVDK